MTIEPKKERESQGRVEQGCSDSNREWLDTCGEKKVRSLVEKDR